MRYPLFLLANFFISFSVFGQSHEDDLLNVVEAELKREMSELEKAAQPPYYLSYRINDEHSVNLSSSFGSLTYDNEYRSRIMVIDMRVGDYNFDNTHAVDDLQDLEVAYDRGPSGSVKLPLDNRAEALQFTIWQHTQDAYRSALTTFKSLKSNQKPTSDNNTPPVADFSKEKAAEYIDPPLQEMSKFFDRGAWKEKIKLYTAPFLSNPDIVDADASIEAGLERKYFISSEGSRIVQNRAFAYLTIRASIRADDGDIVPLHKSYFVYDPTKFPSDEVILQDVKKMMLTLDKLRTAPIAEPYTGPAILNAHAAGVFFHEIFGHRVEGHRLKNKMDGQTFRSKIKEQVLPKTLNVVFDPTLTNYNGQALNGAYVYDDEGVKSQSVNVVEKGILKTFLMSRSPIADFTTSNGHGRAQAGAETVSRQSNLLIENDKPVSMTELRKMLISECKKQKKTYGYLFMDVVGGFTTTDRYMPNAFNIFPTEVYRVYVDGRPDELVRGVDLIGTPLAMFAEIKAADDKTDVFTGFCGAESGSIPVTAISPSLFVKRIETQKKPTKQIDKAILEKPYQK